MQHTLTVVDQIGEGFACAIERSCGIEYVDLFRKSCGVKVSSNYRKFGDCQTSCAGYLFHHHQAVALVERMDLKTIESESEARVSDGNDDTLIAGGDKVVSQECSSQDNCDCGPVECPMIVTTVSEFGFVRERRYASAIELAEAIIAALPETLMGSVVSDVHVQPSARACAIDVTSAPHLAWQLSQGHYPCRSCGRFCLGTQGLRTHQVQEHVLATDLARRAAIDTAWQLVPYTGTCNPVPVLLTPPMDTGIIATTKPPPEKTATDTGVADTTPPPVPMGGMDAAKEGALDVLRSLVAGGWDPREARDRERNTPLTWAAGNGHLAVCRFLVDECGVDPRAATGTRKHRREPMHWAARNGRVEVCAWLVGEHGADVDAPTENGTTPLHLAISQGKIDVVRWLVESGGCDINRCNGFGCNAAHWSGLRGDVPLLQYLHTHGLDYFHFNDNGRSALHKGAVKGNRATCEWLLLPRECGGAGLDHRHMQPEQCGDTPMTLAASCSEMELAAYLQTEYDLSVARSKLKGVSPAPAPAPTAE